jgi:hypothetical protein
VLGAKKGVISLVTLQVYKGDRTNGALWFYKGARANGTLVEL